MIEGWIWLIFAALGVLGMGAVAFAKNVVRSGFGLLFALLSVCAMYAFLGADFLAATQVIVYVGGILVLVLFGVMMTHRIQAASLREEVVQPFAAGIGALIVFGLSMMMILGQDWGARAVLEEPTGATRALGRGFLTDFLFPFEFASVLLLVAMIGAAMLTREKAKPEKQEVE